jgi:hypothetical protein
VPDHADRARRRGAAVRDSSPLDFIVAKRASPIKYYRLYEPAVVMRGLDDGGLFASDKRGATATLPGGDRP